MFRSLLLCLLTLVLPQAVRADQAVAPVASYVVTTHTRTLRNLPLKHIVLDAKGWRRVTQKLAEAPPPPDFSRGQVSVFIVADISGGAKSWVDGIQLREDGSLKVQLYRKDGLGQATVALKCFFFHVKGFPGGVKLEHRTQLAELGGFVQRDFPPAPRDRDPRLLSRLGPDIRLSCAMMKKGPLPKGIKIRHEAYYARRDLPAKVRTLGFSSGLAFPRIRDGVTHVFAAFAPGYRSQNPLVMRKLPRIGKAGSPLPILHRFKLEPVPK